MLFGKDSLRACNRCKHPWAESTLTRVPVLAERGSEYSRTGGTQLDKQFRTKLDHRLCQNCAIRLGWPVGFVLPRVTKHSRDIVSTNDLYLDPDAGYYVYLTKTDPTAEGLD